MLLKRDEVSPDKPSNDGGRPLWVPLGMGTREW